MALNLSRNTKVFVSSGNGATATGAILTAHITSAGDEYVVGNVITFGTTSGSGSGAKGVVLSVDVGNGLATIGMPNNFRGSGYADGDTITASAVIVSLTDSSTQSGTTNCVVTVDSVTSATTTQDGSRTGAGLFKGNEETGNCFRMGVLDGYSFSQGSESTDVTISETGATPNRGSKRFNDALPPVEWSFGTYVRPFKHGSASFRTANDMDMCENIMWAAIAGKDITDGALSSTSAAAVTCDSTDADISFARSEHHELLKLNIYFALENTTYRLNDAQVNTAEIDFSIDGIAQITWSGNATTIDQVAGSSGEDPSKYLIFNTTEEAATIGTTAGNVETINFVDTTGPSDADYLRNKLSTLTLSAAEQGGGASSGGLDSKTYDIAITGGSITIANNITYVTPETLGVIDKPIGSFSGARQISGSLTMYLNTTGSSGSGNGSNQLLADLAGATDLVRNSFDMSLFMGGGSSDTPVVEFDLPRAHFQVPAIEVADLISVSVEFAAHGSDITAADEMTVKYKGLTSHNDSTYAADNTVTE